MWGLDVNESVVVNGKGWGCVSAILAQVRQEGSKSLNLRKSVNQSIDQSVSQQLYESELLMPVLSLSRTEELTVFDERDEKGSACHVLIAKERSVQGGAGHRRAKILTGRVERRLEYSNIRAFSHPRNPACRVRSGR